MAKASTGSAGTKDVRVDRPEEGLPGVATTDNTTANPPTRASFDSGESRGIGGMRTKAVIPTDPEVSGLTWDQQVKRGDSSAW